ncbi:MAG: hypothetical protein Q9221_003317 [Calogaya cf. arnoldii]
MALLSIKDSLVLFSSIFIVYNIALVIYRLYFSPLAKFPGPKLAAATLWYEYYYDVVQRGRYTWKIAELHAQYGPLLPYQPRLISELTAVIKQGNIRILCRSDTDHPSYYDELYVGPSTRRTLKYERAIRGFGPTNYVFSTISHELHRSRRGAVAPFFSKALVQQLEPTVDSMIQKLVNRLNKLKGTGTVINLVDYAFASPYGYLDMPEFAPLWHNALMEASEAFHFFAQFPWLETFMRQLPQPLVREMVPNLSSLFLMTDMVREKVDQVQADLADNKKPDGQRTIFHDLSTNNALIPEERTPERLAAEGMALISAGSQTVAHTLAVITYHIIANPEILRKLHDKLASALPSDGSAPKWGNFEQLPYLVSSSPQLGHFSVSHTYRTPQQSDIIQEGLR